MRTSSGPADRRARKGAARRWRWASLLFAFLLLAATVLVIAGAWRVHLATAVGTLLLARSDLAGATFRVAEIDATGIVLVDIDLSPRVPIVIPRLSVAFTLAGLVRRHLDRIAIEGARGDVSDLGALAAATAGGGAGGRAGGQSSLSWTIGLIELGPSHFVYAGDAGSVRADVAGQVRLAGDSRYAAAFVHDVTADLGGGVAFRSDGRSEATFGTAGVETARLQAPLNMVTFPGLTVEQGYVLASLSGDQVRAMAEAFGPTGALRIDASGPRPWSTDPVDLAASGRVAVGVKDLDRPDLPGVRGIAGEFTFEMMGGKIAVRPATTAIVAAELGGRAVEARLPAAPPSVIDVDFGAPTGLAARIRIGHVDLAGSDLVAALDGVEASLAAAALPQLTLNDAALTLRQPLAFPTPVRLSGSVSAAAEGIRFSATARATKGGLRLDVSGVHDPEAGRGEADVRLAPLTFSPGTLQPADLLPALGGGVTDASARLTAEGPIRWRDGVLSSNLRVALSDATFTAGAARVEALNTSVVLTRPWPPVSEPDQRAAARRIDAGLTISDPMATFRLLSASEIAVAAASGRVLGGRFTMSPMTLRLPEPEIGSTVSLSAFDIGQMVDLAGLDHLAVEGRMDGELVFAFDGGGRLTTLTGALRSADSGTLRYTPPVAPPALAGSDGEGVSLLMRALRDFRFDSIRLDLDGRVESPWTGTLRLQGRNPSVLGGQTFILNIALSGEIYEVIRSALGGQRLPAHIGEQLRQQQGQGR